MKTKINPFLLKAGIVFFYIGVCALFSFNSGALASENPVRNNLTIQVSPNGRYLQWSDGTPIYIHADTGWSLTRDYSPEEVTEYLDRTVGQKFNTIQMSAVFHAVRPDQDIIGPAFYDADLTRPREDYWAQVDRVVEETTKRGLIVVLNPIWKRQHVNTIQKNGVENCHEYGKWFAERFKDNPYVIYFVCGDATPDPVKDELAAMAEGIQEVYGGKAIIAVHSRQTTSSLEVYSEQPDWLTLNWTYAYSPKRADWNLWPYEHNLRNYQKFPDRPIHFCEGYYDAGAARDIELNGVIERFGSRYAIRRQAWYASFITGSTGHAYGAEAIWHHNRWDETWQMALEYESRKDMAHKITFVDQIDWWTLVPDMNQEFLTDGFGTFGSEDYVVAAVSSDKNLAVIYTPVRHELQINLNKLAKGIITAEWFDPTNGILKPAEGFPTGERGILKIFSPMENSSGTSDFVLLVRVGN